MALIENTPRGLYCPAGDFYIDPWKCDSSMRAVITHGHSDHARAGCGSYLCSPSCEPILRARLGRNITTQALPFGLSHELRIGDALVALLPAGHVLGSAMIRIRRAPGTTHAATPHDDGGTWLITGDYKLTADGLTEPAELCPCDTLITESTFGLPVFRWQPDAQLRLDLNTWWHQCQQLGRTAVVFAYSLGKAQRILAMADAALGPLLAHPAALAIVQAYRTAGATLPEITLATPQATNAARAAGAPALLVAPQSVDGSAWLTALGPVATAVASGWMAIRGTRRRSNISRGFAISDHADWPQLLSACRQTGASRIGVTHGYTAPLVRYLTESGTPAFELATRFSGESPQPIMDTSDAADAAAAAEPPDPPDA